MFHLVGFHEEAAHTNFKTNEPSGGKLLVVRDILASN